MGCLRDDGKPTSGQNYLIWCRHSGCCCAVRSKSQVSSPVQTMNTENRLPLALLLSAVERVCDYVRPDSRVICRAAACIQDCGGFLSDLPPRQCSHRGLSMGRN